MFWDYGLFNAFSIPFSKGDQPPIPKKSKDFYGLVYEAHGIDPLIKNEI